MKIFLAIVVSVIVAVGTLFLCFYNSPTQKEERAYKEEAKAQQEKSALMSDYLALSRIYLANHCLSLEEDRQFRTLLEKAKGMRDKYLYGSKDYITMNDFCSDFTSSSRDVPVTELNLPDGFPSDLAKNAASAFYCYDTKRETMKIRKELRSWDGDQNGTNDLIKSLTDITNDHRCTAELKSQIQKMVTAYKDEANQDINHAPLATRKLTRR